MKIFITLALLSLALVNTVVSAKLIPMEDNRTANPTQEGWRSAGRAAPDHTFPMVIAVKLQNQDVLKKHLMMSSDPESPNFSQHLSLEEVNAITHPSDVAVDTIVRWLNNAGIGDINDDNVIESGFLGFRVTAAQAERLLSAPFHRYVAKDADDDVADVDAAAAHRRITRVAPGARYLIDDDVAQHIDFVAPTVHFPPVHKQRHYDERKVEQMAVKKQKMEAKRRQLLSEDAGTLIVYPKWLRQLYQVGDAIGSAATGNSACVASFIGQFYSPADLNKFWKTYSPTLVGSAVHQVGANNYKTKGAGDEASLDVQYLSSVGQGVPLWVWYSGNQELPFLQFVQDVAKTPDAGVPKIFSMSYGSYEDGYSKKMITRIDTEMMKLATRGITMFVASGDSGAGGNCTTANETPTYPASSPFVTTVGGLTGGNAGNYPTGEHTDNISGGGFSTVFPREKYQDKAARRYLSETKFLPPQGDFNANGQAYPDLAAQSEGFIIEFDGIGLPFVGGTSCACPTMAGVWSLLNEARMKAGKKHLGFLNPMIYKLGDNSTAVFNDVVVGNDKGCGTGVGYRAAPGYDAATGWGSISYKNMLPYVMSLP